MPEWICEVAQVSRGTGYGALGAKTAGKVGPVSRVRIQNFVTSLLRSRLDSVRDLPVAAWTPKLPLPSNAVWSGRALTALLKTDLLSDSRKLAAVTFGELSQVPGMGIRTMLDLLCTMEAQVAAPGDNLMQGEQFELAMPDIEPYLARLRSASSSSWADLVSDADPRFKHLLPSGSGTFADRVDEVLEGRDFPAAVALAKASDEIAVIASRIDNSRLEDLLGELAQLFAKLGKDHHEALMSRLGWLGLPPITLAEGGDMINVTRERMRQLEAKVLRRIPEDGIYAPPVARAVELLAAASPLPVLQVPALLREAGLTGRPFYAESVISAANAVGIEHSLQIQRVGAQEFVCIGQHSAQPKKIVAMARSMSGAGGAAKLTDLVERLAEAGISTTVEGVTSILQGANVRFLGDDWVWFPDIAMKRSRLRNLTRRMLSVVSPIHVSRIREGIRREVFYINSVKGGWPIAIPPEAVLTRYYAEHREFTVSATGMVGSLEALDYRAELTGIDQMLVDVIRAVPTGILDRASLRDAVVRRGANTASFEQSMTYSAIVERIDKNIWTARGLQLDPNAIAACREANARRPQERRVTGFGWTDTGEAWFAAVLPSHFHVLVLGIPGEIKRFLADRRFEDIVGSGAGISVGKDGTSFGYGPILRRLGAEPGDIMVAVFDILKGTVSIRLGGSELEDED